MTRMEDLRNQIESISREIREEADRGRGDWRELSAQETAEREITKSEMESAADHLDHAVALLNRAHRRVWGS